MSSPIKEFLLTEDGATAIEYGLIAALIALAIIGAISALGGSNGDMWNRVGSEVADGLSVNG